MNRSSGLLFLLWIRTQRATVPGVHKDRNQTPKPGWCLSGLFLIVFRISQDHYLSLNCTGVLGRRLTSEIWKPGSRRSRAFYFPPPVQHGSVHIEIVVTVS